MTVLEVVGSGVGVTGVVAGGGGGAGVPGVVTVGVTPTGGATLGSGAGTVGLGVTADGVSGDDAVTLGAASAGPEGAAEQPMAAPEARMKTAENGPE